MEGAEGMPTNSGVIRRATRHVSGFPVSSHCDEHTHHLVDADLHPLGVQTLEIIFVHLILDQLKLLLFVQKAH